MAEGTQNGDQANQRTKPYKDMSAAEKWADHVEDFRSWCAGTKACDACDHMRECGDCDSTRVRLIPERFPGTGSSQMHEGAGTLASLLGDFKARGGIEHLPERSRKFVEDLHSGLGALLFDIIARAEALETDLCATPDEHWPMGEQRYRELYGDLSPYAAKADAE